MLACMSRVYVTAGHECTNARDCEIAVTVVHTASTVSLEDNATHAALHASDTVSDDRSEVEDQKTRMTSNCLQLSGVQARRGPSDKAHNRVPPSIETADYTHSMYTVSIVVQHAEKPRARRHVTLEAIRQRLSSMPACHACHADIHIVIALAHQHDYPFRSAVRSSIASAGMRVSQ